MSALPTDSPTVHVMAGCNGAGKTTFVARYLSEFIGCDNFLNADFIAARLNPGDPESQALRAGRLFLKEIQKRAADGDHFGFETTLSGRTYFALLSDLKRRGYRLHLHFLWLPSPEMAIARVVNRVLQGGHSVPPADIRRRYSAGLRNLFGIYRSLFDTWWLYDSSQNPPLLLARKDAGQLRVFEPQRFFLIRRQAGVTE